MKASTAVSQNTLVAVNQQVSEMENQTQVSQQNLITSQQSLMAQQRPWVSIRPEIPDGKYIVDDNGVSLKVIFHLKNTGPTPAVNVVFIPKGFSGPVATTQKLKEMCDGLRAGVRTGFWTFTLFPGEDFPLTFPVRIASAEEQIALKNTLMTPSVIACVDYQFAIPNVLQPPISHHQTWIADDIHPNLQDGIPAEGPVTLIQHMESGSFVAD